MLFTSIWSITSMSSFPFPFPSFTMFLWVWFSDISTKFFSSFTVKENEDEDEVGKKEVEEVEEVGKEVEEVEEEVVFLSFANEAT